MKYFIFMAILISGMLASANTIFVEVDVPADAKQIVFTAKDAVVDNCNTYHLEILPGWGAATGTYTVYPSGTELPCLTPAQKKVELSKEVDIDTNFGQPKTITVGFPSVVMTQLKIDFK